MFYYHSQYISSRFFPCYSILTKNPFYWDIFPLTKKKTERINQSKWIKLYIALAVIQGIMIIALESVMATQNLSQGIILQNLDEELYGDIIRRLKRTKWENIAFASIQVWFVSMVVDAVSYYTYFLSPFLFKKIVLVKKENKEEILTFFYF